MYLWTKGSNFIVNLSQIVLQTLCNTYQTLSGFYVEMNNPTLKFI